MLIVVSWSKSMRKPETPHIMKGIALLSRATTINTIRIIH